ncbi:MAG: hypothetical protein SPL51_04250 [Lachnospiraceae bacterium]|nr:hypothetical protein [Lachnospiraceae bacterium]
MSISRFLGWLLVIVLLAAVIYCKYKVGNPFANACFDVVITVSAFLLGYYEAKRKSTSRQAQKYNRYSWGQFSNKQRRF